MQLIARSIQLEEHTNGKNREDKSLTIFVTIEREKKGKKGRKLPLNMLHAFLYSPKKNRYPSDSSKCKLSSI